MENELIEKVMQEITVRLECDNLKKALSDSEYSYGWKMGAKAALAATLGFIEEQRKTKKYETYAILFKPEGKDQEERVQFTTRDKEMADHQLEWYQWFMEVKDVKGKLRIVKLKEE